MQDTGRNRDYIDAILTSEDLCNRSRKATLDELAKVYKSSIKPLEEAYKFSDLQCKQNPVAEIYAKPSLLVLGPWSSGKTSMINYILGLEGRHALRVGAEPTSSDFVIIEHGPNRKTVSGTTLLSDESKPYKPLEQYGMDLAARLQALELPVKALQHLTVVDTPGIMENTDQRKQGYPYLDVCQWFIKRAALIFFVFDPSKLDAGKQLREMFRRLKGHEGKLRIVLNKADSFDPVTLLRTYGAFCWTLKSLMPYLPEPPHVHMVSCWPEPFKATQFKDVFLAEEKSLVQDIKEAIDNHSEMVLTSLLSHALYVETHAVIVDAYLHAFDTHRHRWLLWKNGALQADVVDCPDLFDIPQNVGEKTFHHDGYLNVLTYRRFFLKHPLSSFYRASQGRDGVIFSGATVLEKAQEAIRTTIPNLLTKQRSLRTKAIENEEKKGQTVTGAVISNSLNTLRATGQQLKELTVGHPFIGALRKSSPLNFVTQKVQSALKSYS